MNNLTLKQRIQEDMKAAMKAQATQKLGTIRLLMAAIKQREVDERITLDDSQVLAVIDKMIKQRQDSANQFQQANRLDLAEQENFEISVLQGYLPPALSDQEIRALIDQAITALNASSMKDMGRVMAELKPQLQGRADMAVVSSLIKEKLS
ncbi:MAG TPA: GatB/YqeY domain-containing protein [Gammaproteobacteria bacterium]|nr:GatB/YqeY domain-containing protein [Gammaproteobacteria bacterium]